MLFWHADECGTFLSRWTVFHVILKAWSTRFFFFFKSLYWQNGKQRSDSDHLYHLYNLQSKCKPTTTKYHSISHKWVLCAYKIILFLRVKQLYIITEFNNYLKKPNQVRIRQNWIYSHFYVQITEWMLKRHKRENIRIVF